MIKLFFFYVKYTKVTLWFQIFFPPFCSYQSFWINLVIFINISAFFLSFFYFSLFNLTILHKKWLQ